jgi:hypothetical protein
MAIARITHSVICAGRILLLAASSGLISLAGAQTWNWGYDPSWSSHVSVGAMAGFNIKADFKMGGKYNIPITPGVYDNGYVHPSQNVNGLTSNWGYESAGQIQGQNLVMAQTTAFEAPNITQNTDMNPSVGFQATYGGNLWYVGRFRLGWEFGFGWLPIDISVNQSSTPALVDQSTYLFNYGNITLPPPGYHGTASGGPSITNSATQGPSTNGASGTFTGSQTLDVNLFTFRLGPSVYWDFNHHVGMSLGAGPALGYAPGQLKYNQTISANGIPSKSQGSVSVSDVVYGWYANTMVTVHLVRNGDLFLGAEYMPLSTANFSGGGREASLNLKGQIYVTAGINWPF